MKIAIINEHWGAGAARTARDLERELGKRHDVLFFPRTKAPETPDSVFEGLAHFQPDVVNIHSFYGGLPYEFLPELSRRYPVCWTVHDPRPIGTMETECWECNRNTTCLRCPLISSRFQKVFFNRYFRERMHKRRCHARCKGNISIVTPSQWLAERLRQQELKRFPVTCIPNGVDLARFTPGNGDRSRFGIPQNGVILLHLAWHLGWKINERKGLRFLAEAFSEHVLPQVDNAYLAVAGERFMPNLPNVIPLGMVNHDDLPDLFSSVDLFVSPTLADNFPYTIIEAMACGKPVIASRVGGIPEQIADGRTGLLVAPGNSRELGEALVKFLSDGNRANYGIAARRMAEANLSMDAFVGAYESCLLKLKDDSKSAGL